MSPDAHLAQVLAEFARTLGSDFSIQSTLDHLVERIVEALPVTGAGITLMGEGEEMRFISATNSGVLAIQSLQAELGEGPCLTAFKTGESVAIADLSQDTRFPRFSADALDHGMAAVFTIPLSLDKTRLGVLDLYRDVPGPLTSSEMAAAETLADVAAAYLFNARAREEAKERAQRLHYLARHDALTGLPNRSYLEDLLDDAVASSQRSGTTAAVLFVDLDGFKAINDRFGHHVGDLLLTGVATRLSSVIAPEHSLARLSGDEFVIVCRQLSSPSQAEEVAAAVRRALAESFRLDGYLLHVTASVGVSYTENGNDTPKRLLRNADFAMYLAKRAGGGQHRVMDATALLSDSGDVLQRGIESALQRNEFRLAYQPIVTIADSTLHGVEALLRWKDPARGWVMPEVIVPIAERTGLIEELGKWALNTACLELRDWQKNFGAGAVEQMAVNVSAHQLMGSEFVDTVAEVLDRSGVAPGHLLLEITESVLLIDAPRAREVLGELKRLGVRLALDDFGTGYSSLGYLKRFPFDTVKIDREFIADMCADPATRAIVASVIDLAHALDLSVVAEGIETRQQLQQVEDLGADRAQGHYFSVALLTEAFSTTILEASGGPALTSAPIRLPLPATAPNS